MDKVNKTLWQKLKDGESFQFVVNCLIALGLFLIIAPYLITQTPIFSFGHNNVGEIGDVIGGTTAPFISFVGVFVTFLAFWIQFKANIELRKDFEFSKFENKYYELLKLHRANVEEMNIANKYNGRNCFVYMFKELAFLYFTIEDNYMKKVKINKIVTERSKEELCNIAYKLFFYGIEEDSFKTIQDLIIYDDRIFVQPALSDLQIIQRAFLEWEEERKTVENFDYNSILMKQMMESKKNVPISYKTSFTMLDKRIINFETIYYPFVGHASKLSHYFRHLFQAVKFIDEEISLSNRSVEKANYIQTIRAQLSNHEQLMLYYNSLSSFGKRWIDPKNNYLKKYRLIHNIPIPLASIGPLPKEKFAEEVKYWEENGNGNHFFEWDEFAIKYESLK